MIQPTEKDVGRFVVYSAAGQPAEAGRISAVRPEFIHVRFPGNEHLIACRREDLTWLDDLVEKPAPLDEPALAAIVERHAATTQGPWYANYYDETVARHPGWSVDCNMPDVLSVATVHHGYGNDGEMEGNAKFIAAVHQDIPALIAALNHAHGLIDDFCKDGGLVPQDAIPIIRSRREVSRLRESLNLILRLTVDPGLLFGDRCKKIQDAAQQGLDLS